MLPILLITITCCSQTLELYFLISKSSDFKLIFAYSKRITREFLIFCFHPSIPFVSNRELIEKIKSVSFLMFIFGISLISSMKIDEFLKLYILRTSKIWILDNELNHFNKSFFKHFST